MEKPLFSVIIPTYNRAGLIGRCLKSVIDQTYSNWEAIVIDNFSEDNTEEIVQGFGDDRIHYFKNHNYGVISVSRNFGLDRAKGDWIAFLDSDDAWMPNKLEMVAPYMEKYDIVYHGYKKDLPIKKQRRLNQFFYEIKEPSVNYVIQRGDPINPSCTCVSKKAIGDIRFDENKELFAVEDYDFFLQLLYKGITVKYLHEILTLYDMSGCSHVEIAADRDLKVFKKWAYLLSDAEKLEVKHLNSYTRACACMDNLKYKDAVNYYREAAKSKIWMNKKKAIKGLVRSFVYSIIK